MKQESQATNISQLETEIEVIRHILQTERDCVPELAKYVIRERQYTHRVHFFFELLLICLLLISIMV